MIYIFHYESQILGGVEVLFANLILNFSQNNKAAFIFTDDNESIYYQLLPNHLIISSNDIKKINKNKNIQIITPLSNTYQTAKQFSKLPQSKLLLWAVHPLGALWLTPLIGSRIFSKNPVTLKFIHKTLFFWNFILNKRLISLANDLGATHFMDISNLNKTNFFYDFNIKVSQKDYLPIPQKHRNKQSVDLHSKEILNIVFLGRLEDWKLIPLINFIEQLIKHNISHIHLSIVGGKEKDASMLTDRLVELKVKHTLYPVMDESNLNLFFTRHFFHLGIAMGTSALDLAVRSIPTLTINPSLKYTKNQLPVVTWIYNTKNYSLGDFEGVNENNILLIFDIIKHIANLKNKHYYDEKSSKCLEYVLNHHDIHVTAKRLENASATNLLCIKNVLRLYYLNPLVLLRSLWKKYL